MVGGGNVIFIGKDYVFEKTGWGGRREIGGCLQGCFGLFDGTWIGVIVRVTGALENIDSSASAVLEGFGFVFGACHCGCGCRFQD